MHIILLNGAPGSGKSTVGAILHEKLRCPWFEFGWIPEFRHLNPHTEISYEEEEALSFENLMLVVQNYLRHGFEQIIISDLRPEMVCRAADVLQAYAPRVFTLYADDAIIRQRVLTRRNGNDYRDGEQAIHINRRMLASRPLPGEMRLDTTALSPEKVCECILRAVV